MESFLIFFLIFILLSVLMRRILKRGSSDRENIQKLLRQTARWATAAEQDGNPYIRNLHATYAVGYLMALREIYSDEKIKMETGLDIRKMEEELTKIMDNAIQEIVKVCPEGQPKNEFLANISKQGKIFDLFK